MSEKIVDDYSDDFDQVEESMRPAKKGEDKSGDSSGGFEEQQYEDMFWKHTLHTQSNFYIITCSQQRAMPLL